MKIRVVDNRTTEYEIDLMSFDEAKTFIEEASPEELADLPSEMIHSEWYVEESQDDIVEEDRSCKICSGPHFTTDHDEATKAR